MDDRAQAPRICYPTEVFLKDEVVIIFLRRHDILHKLCPDDNPIKFFEISMDFQPRKGRNEYLHFQGKK